MYEHILFPIDDSASVETVFPYVLDLVVEHDSTLHLLHVADTTQDSVTRIGTDVVDALRTEGKEIVAEARERADDRGVSVVTEVRQGRVPTTIIEYATDLEIDLIVMPTQGRSGIKQALLGSVTERVIRRSPIPVRTISPQQPFSAVYPPTQVLVPTDGSEGATRAVTLGSELAATHGAAMHILSVVDVADVSVDLSSPFVRESLTDHASSLVKDATARAQAAGVETVTGTVEHGMSVQEEIRDYVATNDIELVVLGTHGRTGVDRYLLGSVAERVVRTLSVPVQIVPVPRDQE